MAKRGKLMVDGQDYSGYYLGAYPDAIDQNFDTTDAIHITKNNVQEAIHELDLAITNAGGNVNTDDLTITLGETVVTADMWSADTTYEDYPFRAAILCEGVTEKYIPYVIFQSTESGSVNFAPFSATGTNEVYIYAVIKPTYDITLEGIQCTKPVTVGGGSASIDDAVVSAMNAKINANKAVTDVVSAYGVITDDPNESYEGITNVPNLTVTHPEMNDAIAEVKENLSNPNLIDNAWFTVNQRGQTTYNTAWEYTLDRWHIGDGVSVDVVDNGITYSNNGTTEYGFYQVLSLDLYHSLVGKKVTTSVMYEDGEIVSDTCLIDKVYNEYHAYNNPDVQTVQLISITNDDGVTRLTAGLYHDTTKVVRAVKLEVGEVSTLVMDAMPSYESESYRCVTSKVEANDTYANKMGVMELNTNLSELNNSLNETKKSVSDGKSAVASAITAKGVSTATDATFNTMAANINAIKTLSNLADAGHTLVGGNGGTTYANLSAGRYLLFIVYSNLNGDCWVSHSPQPTALRSIDAPYNQFRGNTTKMYVGYLDIPTMTVSTTIRGTDDHLVAYTFYVKLV